MKIYYIYFNVQLIAFTIYCRTKGDFSRLSEGCLDWNYRRNLLRHEILQYNPDIITLHEVDHYYDFFLPDLSKRGYIGVFAPKPMSQCLEVSSCSDGSCIFIKAKLLSIISTQIFPFATADADDGTEEYYSVNKMKINNKLYPRSKQRRQQNQVCIIIVCQLNEFEDSPPIIIATASLKTGEYMKN